MPNDSVQHHVTTAERIEQCARDHDYLTGLLIAYRNTLRAMIGDEALADLEARAPGYMGSNPK